MQASRMSCSPSAPGTATGGRWSRWSNGTHPRCGGSPGTCFPTPRTLRTPPRNRLPSSAPASASSGERPGSPPGSTAWCPTPVATLASVSGAGLTSRWRRWPNVPADGEPIDLALSASNAASWPRSSPPSIEQRHVMVMKDVLSLSYQEIADVLDMPVGTGQVPRSPRPGPDAPGDVGGQRGGHRVTQRPASHSTAAGIEAIIPHRDPFLLIDEGSLSSRRASTQRGRYTGAGYAWYLRGHFPGLPIMPGVLQVEALAPGGARCAGLRTRTSPGSWRCSQASRRPRFKRIVVPGDTLDLHCSITRLRAPRSARRRRRPASRASSPAARS